MYELYSLHARRILDSEYTVFNGFNDKFEKEICSYALEKYIKHYIYRRNSCLIV